MDSAHKQSLVEEIRNNSVEDRELASTDLSNCDLRGVYLEFANMRGADLSNTDLRDAELEGAYLEGANLSGANLEHIHLTDAEIQGARFGSNLGMSEEMKQDLIKRGAIFEDFPAD